MLFDKMNSKYLVMIIMAAALILLLFIAASSPQTSNRTSANSTLTNQSSAQTNNTKTLLNNTAYARFSYQIYPGPLSQAALSAMTGFNMTNTTLQNGSVAVKIAVVGSGQNQTIVLKPGYRLYVVEGSFGDDSIRYDSSFGDDGFVVVDQNGYVS